MVLWFSRKMEVVWIRGTSISAACFLYSKTRAQRQGVWGGECSWTLQEKNSLWSTWSSLSIRSRSALSFDFPSWGIKWNWAFATSFIMFEITEITASKIRQMMAELIHGSFLSVSGLSGGETLTAIYRPPWVTPLQAVIILWDFFIPAIYSLPKCSGKSKLLGSVVAQEMAQSKIWHRSVMFLGVVITEMPHYCFLQMAVSVAIWFLIPSNCTNNKRAIQSTITATVTVIGAFKSFL